MCRSRFPVSGTWLFCICSIFSCSKQPLITGDLNDYNVIIIVSDALRADHLGCNGYSYPISPFIDSLASHSINYVNARSNSSYTRESVTALFTGLLPSTSRHAGWLASPDSGSHTMAGILGSAGYISGFFTDWPVIWNNGFRTGFTESECFTTGSGSRPRHSGGRAPAVADRGLEFLEQNAENPCFLYMHFQDPHAPYSPPHQAMQQFENYDARHVLGLHHEIKPYIKALTHRGFGPGDPRYGNLIMRYDGEIAFIDYTIRRFFEGLRKLDILDETVVIITSDHGEEFLEHGYVEHAWTLYEESIRIPFILWINNRVRPQIIKTPISLIDVVPGICTLLDLPVEVDHLDGKSFIQPSARGFMSDNDSRRIISELLIQHRCMIRSVVHGHWKYIAVQKWIEPEDRHGATAAFLNGQRFESMDPWGTIIRDELYNIKNDPQELKNLISEEPEHAQRYRDCLEQFRLERQSRHGDPWVLPGNLPDDEVRKLKALGYL